MKQQYILSLRQARNIQLATLGLLTSLTKRTSKDDVLQTIKNMSLLQIDTIHVVNRSPYLVLWSRIGDFELEWLSELLKERKIFEYWSHAACFIPIENYPLYKAFIDNKDRRDYIDYEKWIEEHAEDVAKVLQYIKRKGAVMSATFNQTKKEKGGWWNWKFEKIVLESLFYTGILTTSERRKFQKVYDLTHRVIPREFRKEVKLEKAYEELVERSVKHLGITKKEWVPDYFRLKKTVAYPVFEKLLKQKKFVEVTVEGKDGAWYVHKDNMHLVKDALACALTATHTTFLSPFDPLVWDRFRAKELFNFEYQIESYTPLAKREYGYFTLPVLYHGQLIGRMDAKAHRKDGIFEVKALHFEDSFKPNEKCLREIVQTLQKFANWHSTPKLDLSSLKPSFWKESLQHTNL